MLIVLQKQALLWCINRENPVLPQSETDHPVQFWQLKQDNGKVSALFSRVYICSCVTPQRFYFNRTSSPPPISQLTHRFISGDQDPTRSSTQARQGCFVRRQHGLVRA